MGTDNADPKNWATHHEAVHADLDSAFSTWLSEQGLSTDELRARLTPEERKRWMDLYRQRTDSTP